VAISRYLPGARATPILRLVTRRRLVQLFVLAALVLAPFGRIGVAQAKAMPNHGAMAASHCAGQPTPDTRKDRRTAADCMIACAVMAPAAAPVFVPPPAAEAVQAPVARLFLLSGIRPEADPPPPRFS
jgi:hypothetical protein